MGGQKGKQVIVDCQIGANTVIWNFVNLYGCEIGDNCMIGAFVEIQKDVKIGNNVRVSSHSFVCSKVKIGNNVFVGHGVTFINDLYPPRPEEHWSRTIIEDNVTIGSNATILPVKIGTGSIIGAGAVVTRDVLENTIVVGNPAKILRKKTK
ncbi:hypothetical protein A2697_01715 [Candidatus Curtissbacteria bacterium RIFCSPHIGHO2_01_FULL_41_44]|uniref:Acetyltransferase n=1 Tax=Candidatus Curtissbacteria bacterium RIFCSPLOWO2_01_FULL_42_50 TaxID=1797730 RepID=A0A1F5H6E8_9BACT|nr:MAG: hypothetical protein A2697_01715 [Candidatus Curtissbacteria bacterium RIFCSPHIGHO2_01_FULL_41_44]OGD99648.1 MAG: hypothetical protein A3B54_03090 [Candidatus Curtissbacteria bacterium RIFCSPLOWO2_01_FULL_42_50]